ncbi:MAG: hypothetical protein ABS54_13780, partial [Hyphomicrobium sp. SCN 65-11]
MIMNAIDPPATAQARALAARYGTEPKPGQLPWNDVIASLMGHRSVRGYQTTPPPPGTLEILIAAAQSAATSSNLQTWSVMEVTDPEKLKVLAEVANGQKHIIECPIFLVFIADLSRNERLGKAEGATLEVLPYLDAFLVASIDAAMAAQNAVIAAESLGLSTVYIGALRNNVTRVAELLELPSGAGPVFGLCIGYAKPESAGELHQPPIEQGKQEERFDESVLLRTDGADDERQLRHGDDRQDHRLLGERPFGRVHARPVRLLHQLQGRRDVLGRGDPALQVQHAARRDHRAERAGVALHLDERLARLGADGPADEPGGALAELLRLEWDSVVDLGDVARHAGDEDDRGVLAHQAADGLLDVADVVGRDPLGPGRAVAGEVHDAAQHLARLVPSAQDADLGVDGAGGLDDVRIADAGVGHGVALLHQESAVER